MFLNGACLDKRPKVPGGRNGGNPIRADGGNIIITSKATATTILQTHTRTNTNNGKETT